MNAMFAFHLTQQNKYPNHVFINDAEDRKIVTLIITIHFDRP